MEIVTIICLIAYLFINIIFLYMINGLEKRVSELQEELDYVDTWLEETFGPDSDAEP